MSTSLPTPFDRLLAVDLREAGDDEMRALSREAMARGVPLQTLLAELILETARRIVSAPPAQPQPAA